MIRKFLQNEDGPDTAAGEVCSELAGDSLCAAVFISRIRPVTRRDRFMIRGLVHTVSCQLGEPYAAPVGWVLGGKVSWGSAA